MTHHTDAELLRDIEEHMRNMWEARLLPAACWPTELAQRLTKAARRAPAAPVPQGWDLREAAQDALEWLEDDGLNLTHNIRERLRAALAAAPQPPEAAPVQLPEYAAVCTEIKRDSSRGFVETTYTLEAAFPAKIAPGEKLYTEQQVRELLAAHGIGGAE